VAIGVYGFLWGNPWTRRESRLDALKKIIQPMWQTARHLHDANECRNKAEELKAAFPNPQQAPEAAERVNQFVTDYNSHMSAAHDLFRDSEAEFSSVWFRFPDKIKRLIEAARSSLSEFGKLVNDGVCEKARLQFQTFHDDFRLIGKEGRGWRLADPFEGIRRHFRKGKDEEETADPFDISEKAMNEIMGLVNKRATTQSQNTFAVYAPTKLLEQPDVGKSDKVVEDLGDSVFVVRFQDGASRMMTLPELMMFTHQLITLREQMLQLDRMMRAAGPNPPEEVNVTLRVSMKHLMRPEMVKFLLSTIKFEAEPSDAERAA
jgi:hypothetical protein